MSTGVAATVVVLVRDDGSHAIESVGDRSELTESASPETNATENATARAPRRPALRYHGGKWLLAPWIISHFPAHRVYVEPFGGAASVLLRKPRTYGEVYNDLDGEVVNLFRVLRDPVTAAALETALKLTPFARTEFAESYTPSLDRVEQARRTIVRCFMGFGSNAHSRQTGFRANSNRSGTTPAHDWMNYSAQIALFSARMQGVVIEQRPALVVIAAQDTPRTLFYVDPPYVMSTRSDRQRDYSTEMTEDDHRRLAAVLHAVQGMVVVSGYACDLYDRELYAGWRRETRVTHADGAKKRTEVLWSNPACSASLEQPTSLLGGAA